MEYGVISYEFDNLLGNIFVVLFLELVVYGCSNKL